MKIKLADLLSPLTVEEIAERSHIEPERVRQILNAEVWPRGCEQVILCRLAGIDPVPYAREHAEADHALHMAYLTGGEG